MFFFIIRAAYAQRRVFSIMALPVGLALVGSLTPPPTVNYRKSTLHAMRTLFIIVAALTVLWLPYTIVRLVDLQNGGRVPSDVIRMTAWISLLSSTINPLIFLTNKKYNLRFRELLCRCYLSTRWHNNRRITPLGGIVTIHTVSTTVPSDVPSTSGFVTPHSTRSAALVQLKSSTLNVPMPEYYKPRKFEAPVVTITPSSPINMGRGKVSPKTTPKTSDAITGLNVDRNLPTTPVHSLKYSRRDPLGGVFIN